MLFPPTPHISVFELLLLFECLDALCRADKQSFRGILMAPVYWVEPGANRQLVGAFGRIFHTLVDNLAGLNTEETPAFLAARWNIPLQLGSPDGCWCFDNLAIEGALEHRFFRPKGKQRNWLNQRWPEALSRLNAYRKQIALMNQQRENAPPCEKCPICSPHRESWFGEWPYDDDPTITIAPVRERFLQILGAPVFHDRQDRGWCLKQCLHCRSIYHWSSDYDYLVNGASESTTTLNRLTPDEAKPWLALIEQRLAHEVRRT